MAARPLVVFPDHRLRQQAAAVEAFGPDLAALAADIADTLRAVSAIGLTGPHIGVLRRIVVIRLEPAADTHTYVNPVVTWASPALARHEEGSVSMPGVRETVARPEHVRMRYQALDGATRDIEVAGFHAAVLQHEIDQLDGIFWIDRLSRLKRERLVKRYEKLRANA